MRSIPCTLGPQACGRYTGHGEKVPTLAEVLDLAVGRSGVVIEIITPGSGALLYESVRSFGFTGPVIFSSFLHPEIPKIRDLNAAIRTMALI